MTRSRAAAADRAVQRQQRVVKRRVRAPQPSVQARDLNDAAFDHARLAREPNFDVRELAAFLRRSPRAAYMWAYRHRIPHGYVGRRLLFSRRVIERIVFAQQPPE